MVVPRLLTFNSVALFCSLNFPALEAKRHSSQQMIRKKKSQKDDSVKETLIGQMTAINSENSCLMTEHMKSIYQNDNAVRCVSNNFLLCKIVHTPINELRTILIYCNKLDWQIYHFMSFHLNRVRSSFFFRR